MPAPRKPTNGSIDIVTPRPKRETVPGFKVSWSAVKAVAAVLGLAGATVAAIIGVAGAFAGKADTEDLEQVKEVVHDMDTRTQVMQAEQRMLIRYVAPDLPIGSDTP